MPKARKAPTAPNEYFIAEPSGRGRPRLIISERGKEVIETLARIMCTDDEIAACMNTSAVTLTNDNNRETFLACKQKGMEQGKMSLRRIQFKLAEKSAAMAIFLGKNYLGQTDGVEQKLEISNESQNQLVIALRNSASMLDAEDMDAPEGMTGEEISADAEEPSESDYE